MVYMDRPPPPLEGGPWGPVYPLQHARYAFVYAFVYGLSVGSVKALPAVFSGALLAVFK